MKIYEIHAFTHNNQSGNLAGVTILKNPISKIQMQEIANKLGYSETAFVTIHTKSRISIQFFTPLQEVEMCGHATIATLHLLYNKQLCNNIIIIQLGDTQLNAQLGDDIFVSMPTPSFIQTIDKQEIAQLLSIKIEDILITPSIINAGLYDTQILLQNKKTLDSIIQDTNKVKEFSKKYNIIGLHLAAFENNQLYVRNFAPICGIDEESATGTANCGLFYYLKNNNMISTDSLNMIQGYLMNNTSMIMISFSNNQYWIGGKANIQREFIL